MCNEHSPQIHADEWVQVKSKEEILATLDANGRLDELPFMPEMLKYCGARVKVGKRAHKTCDPALGIGGRKMANTVHLSNIRCNGAAHDGCEAGCLIFWKEEWLNPISSQPAKVDAAAAPLAPTSAAGCTEDVLHSSIRVPMAPGETEQLYVCQNTQIKFATQPLPWWDVRQYIEDYTSGNVRLTELAIGLLYSMYRTVAEAGVGVGFAMRWAYDQFQRAIGGVPYPIRPYGVPKGTPVPRATLDLEVGEKVRVKPYKEILKTLDSTYRNRGLYFDAEMVPFTEREYEVERRQKQIIDEASGKMIRFKTDAIILKDAVCEARYAICRRFCPRAIYPYWREIWLERVPKAMVKADSPQIPARTIILAEPGADKYFTENKAYAGLGRASLHSGVIFIAARGANIFVQLASTILLARVLSPHDFGLVAMVVALVGFAPMLIDLGTSEASTQKTHITQADISALFWLNIAIALVLTVLLAGGSSAVAVFFGEPSLTGIALVLSATFILTALSTQHYALMRRAMQFRHIAMIDISANLIGSIVSVAMALTGWGYWSLVAKPVVTAALTVVFVWMSCHWVPGRPRFSSDVKELVGFGLGVTGFTMTDYLAKSADRIAIGYFLGAGPLGYFQNAFTIYSNVLSILTEPLHNIAASSLSKLRNDIDELKRSWTMALSSLSFFSAPAFAVLAVTGQDFVVLLLGQKWAPAGPLLCIFAVRGIAHGVERTMGWIHVAAGRADRWMWWGAFSAVFQLLALAAGLPFGITGVAIAYTIAMFALFVPALVYAGRPVGIGTRDVLQAVGPQTIAALAAVAVGFVVQQEFLGELSQFMRVFLSAMVCAAAYFAVVIGIFGVTDPLRLVFSVLRDFRAARSPAST